MESILAALLIDDALDTVQVQEDWFSLAL